MARPRLTAADYQERLQAYCARYGVEAASSSSGVPPFPAGRRETPQHREWIALRRLHERLARRSRGQCQVCAEPASEGRLVCEAHAAASAGPGAEEARRLLSRQRGRCPICQRPLAPDAARFHPLHGSLLHADCLRLVRLAQELGPEALERVRRYLET